MSNFKSKLDHFVRGQISFIELEQALKKDIQNESSQAPVFLSALEQMAAKKIIQSDELGRLRNIIETLDSQFVDEFPKLLIAYQAQEIGYKSLEKGLVADLSKRPENQALYTEHLNHLRTSGAMAAAVHADLMAVIREVSSHKSADIVCSDDADDDRTQVITRNKLTSSIESNLAEDNDLTQVVSLFDNSSKTSQTSNTQSTLTSGTATSSTWSKPFSKQEETEQVGKGTILKERFEITDFIGKGGMGNVFKAIDLRNVEAQDSENEIAIKVLSKAFRDHPHALKSLQREAKKTRQLAHPHIVNVFDFDRDAQHVFMTMELMVGDPLNKAIRKHPNGLPLELVFKYIKEIGDALEYAHKRGVIHCDLKPGNIFISNNEIKVFDFGIARAASSNIKDDLQRDDFDAGDIGALTPSYASPEMLDGSDDPDPQDDIYALGCITYELLTGSHPFLTKEGKKISASEARDLELRPEKIATLKSWQWEVLKGCLEFSREKRMASVEQFTSEFLISKKPISTKVKVLSAAVSAGLGLSGWFGYQYKLSYDIEQLAILIGSGDAQKIQSKIGFLLESELLQRYLRNPEEKQKLKAYFDNYIEEMVGQNEYQKAQRMLTLAERIYTGAEVKGVTQEFDKAKSQYLSSLLENITDLLDRQEFSTDYTQLKVLLAKLKRVDSASFKAQAPNIALKIIGNIEKLVNSGRYAQALEVTDFSLALLKADNNIFPMQHLIRLKKAKVAINNRISENNKNNQIAVLEQGLTSITEDSVLSQYLDYQDSISALRELSPNSEMLSKTLDIFHLKLSDALSSQLASKQWDSAITLLNAYNQILSSTEMAKYRDKIDINKRNFEEKNDQLIRQITKISRTNTPSDAENILKQLIEHGASAQRVSDAKDIIAKGWLLQAKKERAKKSWESSRKAVDSGLNVVGSKLVKAELQAALEDLIAAQANNNAQENESQSKEAIVLLKQKIEDSLQVETLGIKGAEQLLVLLDELTILVEQSEFIAKRKAKIALLLEAQANLLASENLEVALSFSSQAYNLLPDSEVLEILVTDIKDKIDADKLTQQKVHLADMAASIDLLVNSDDFYQKAEQLEKLLKTYQLEEKDNIYSSATASKIAQRFVSYAEQQIDNNHFDEAEAALANAKRFESTLSTIKLAQKKMSTAKEKFEQEKLDERRKAESESLKNSFDVQLQANDLLLAQKTLEELTALGSNDEFVEVETNGRFLIALKERIAETKPTDDLFNAIELIKAQIKIEPNSDFAKQQLAVFKVAQEIKESITTNPNKANALLKTALETYPEAQLLRNLHAWLKNSVSSNKADIPSSFYPSDQPCDVAMAGRGKSTKQTCYDMLDESTKGPRLIVTPKMDSLFFAITRYEITIRDFNHYLLATGQAEMGGNTNKLKPITNISLQSMQDYSDWLSKVTGAKYTIPTKEQWQFAADGDVGGSNQSYKNCKTYSTGVLVRGVELQKVSYDYKKARNGWGLTHYLGNAQEVVLSTDSWLAAGGSWNDPVKSCTVEQFVAYDGSPNEFTGFRLVRAI